MNKLENLAYKEFSLIHKDEFDKFYLEFLEKQKNKKENKTSKDYREEYTIIKEFGKNNGRAFIPSSDKINEYIDELLRLFKLDRNGSKKLKKERILDYINKKGK